MNIDNAFEKYPDNVFGLRVNKETKIIDFWFNKDWVFPKKETDGEDQYRLKKQKEDPNGPDYFIIFSDDLSFEEWFAIFQDKCKALGYEGPIDKYGVEVYYEEENTPEHAAELFVAEMNE
jgi:hypothetical protein